MYQFINDYSEGCLPEVLNALVETNLESTPGYGTDSYCDTARKIITERFACPDASVHFFVGGTQANFTAITAFLRPWEAVIAAQTAHIYVHETGAVEARGHKIYAMNAPNGKLTPSIIRQAVADHQLGVDEHMVLPRMVYISESTELGTVYSKEELQEIYKTCQELSLFLYIDGARLGTAITCQEAHLACEDLPKLCDAFYIGGTKNGLLFGEAMLIVNPILKPYFRNMIKQNGGMLAKGRLLGVQFRTFMENDLWLKAAKHANIMAERISNGFESAGYSLYVKSKTNQVFVIMPISEANKLKTHFGFEFSQRYDESHEVYRFVTSWATKEEAVTALCDALGEIHEN